MHFRTWAVGGMVAALFALLLVSYVLEFRFAFRDANLFGWSSLILSAALIVQSSLKSRRDSVYVEKSHRETDRGVTEKFFIDRILCWGGSHVALSILLTAFIAIHGSLLILGLLQPSLTVWLGAAAFGALILLVLSGALAERKRKSSQFRSLKKGHVWLTLIFLILAIIHIQGTVSSNLLTFTGLIVAAAITLLVTVTVLVNVPLIIEIRQRLIDY